MKLCIQRFLSASRFVLIAFFCLPALNFAAPCLAEQQDEADKESRPVVSSEVADIELSKVMDGLRIHFADTGEFSDEAEETLKRSLEKQYNSFVSNFKNEKSPETDPPLLKQFELLTEKREAFVEARLDVALNELMGVAGNDMVYRSFLGLCTRLGIRVNLTGKIIEGAFVSDTRIVTLMLPKMDCSGCAKIVRTELAKIEGVFDSATDVEQGNCRVQVAADTQLDQKLDELAKSVVQFQQWTKR